VGSQLVTHRELHERPRETAGLGSALRATGLTHSSDEPEAMKSALKPHIKAYCDMLARNALQGDRTCVRLFAEIVGAVGSKADLVQALVLQVGAQSPEHLTRAASVALDAESVDEETAYAEALRFVNQYRREHGLPPFDDDERQGEVPGA